MDLNEFLEALKTTGKRYCWGFVDGGLIRAGSYADEPDAAWLHMCPIIAVTNEVAKKCYANENYTLAGDTLGLDTDLTNAIVKAADADIGYDPALRQQLITALAIPAIT